MPIPITMPVSFLANRFVSPKHEFVAAFQEVQRIQMLLTILAFVSPDIVT